MFSCDIENNKSLDEQYKNKIMALIHFIRTPLASIKMVSEILRDVFPILVKNYKANIQFADKDTITISEVNLDKLTSIVETLLLEANRISEYMEKIEIK